MAPSSASCSPARPTVTAPTGRTSTQPDARPRLWTCSTTPAVSATGLLLAMACTAVKPPRAAARVPVSTVSASSRPGSRRWVWTSTMPGKRHEAGGFDDGGAVGWVGEVRAACGDDAVADQEVFGFAAEDGGAADEVGRWGCVLLFVCHQLALLGGMGWRWNRRRWGLRPVRGCPRRAAGTGRPSGPKHRSGPVPARWNAGESAAAEEISRPRFMGPGCMMMVSFMPSLSSARRRSSSKPQRREYSRVVGKNDAFIRSPWTRSIITASMPLPASRPGCS